jgi:hypothetical protein
MKRNDESYHVLRKLKRQNDGLDLLVPCPPADPPKEVLKAGGDRAAAACQPSLADMYRGSAGKRSFLSGLFRRDTISTKLPRVLSKRLLGNITIEKRQDNDVQEFYNSLGERDLQVPVDQGRIALWQPWTGTQGFTGKRSKKIIDFASGTGVKLSCGAATVLIISSPVAAITIHLQEERAEGDKSFTDPGGDEQQSAVSIFQQIELQSPLTILDRTPISWLAVQNLQSSC